MYMDANSEKLQGVTGENTKNGELIPFGVVEKQNMLADYDYEYREKFKKNLGRIIGNLMNYKSPYA